MGVLCTKTSGKQS